MVISSEWVLEGKKDDNPESLGPPESISHEEPEGTNGMEPEEPILPGTSAEGGRARRASRGGSGGSGCSPN